MAMQNQACDPRRLDLYLRDRLPNDLQRDVEAHLGVCPACRRRLDELAGGPRWWSEVRQYLGSDGASALDRTLDAAGPLHVPGVNLDFLQATNTAGSLGRLGNYEILEVLGRGGMGVVLKAFDPALHRPVAIKVLAAAFAGSEAARKRFAREAQAAAAVIHDHVVPVHAVDATFTPPYLVMAFIAGQSLQDRVDRSGPLGLREILRIGMQTAAGLAAAHAQGIVHRDIKPANIMLENGIERVRITDFGLARAIDDASVTQAGVLAGTPQYMAPEQARGEVIDQRADLFALGSTMYFMCTGRPPFRGEGGMAVIRQVSDIEPVAIRALNPDIPAWVEGIVRKLHAKNPSDRFGSAAEVADLLEHCLAHVNQPNIQALPARAEELARRVPRLAGARSPRLAKLTLAGALALAVAAAGWWFLPRLFVQPPQALPGDAAVDLGPGELPAYMGHVFAADEFTNQLDQARRQIDLVKERLLAKGQGEWNGPDIDSVLIRERARELARDLAPADKSVNDPVETQIDNIRRRLAEVRENLGRRSDD
jgi:serine/threonine-protein kinase